MFERARLAFLSTSIQSLRPISLKTFIKKQIATRVGGWEGSKSVKTCHLLIEWPLIHIQSVSRI